MNGRIKSISFQLLIWLAYLLIPLMFLGKGDEIIQEQKLIFIYSFVGILSIGGFYLNLYLLLPKFFSRRKYIAFTILSIAYLIFTMFISRKCITSAYFSQATDIKQYVYMIRVPVLWAIAFGIFIFRQYKQLEIEKSKSELALLKAQINPHFLFNILNDIYGQALIKSDSTADSILKLSSIMRYVIEDTKDREVEIEKEVNYLTNYINLQKNRLTDKTKVFFEIKIDNPLNKIPPLLFIGFIENAFKYGVSNEVETTIKIKLKSKKDYLQLEVINDKPIRSISQNLDSTHIGIQNTKRRLVLLYDDKYSLNIIDKKSSFAIYLKIPVYD